MGQQQPIRSLKANQSTSNNNVNFYQLDARLLQKIQNYASSFPADIESIIQQTQQFYQKQQSHFLADFFINQINDRFCNLTINVQAMNNVSNSKTILQIFHISPQFLQHKDWKDLHTKDTFLKFLQHLEQKYWVEQQLYQILNREEDFNKNSQTKKKPSNQKSNQKSKSAFNSVRKPIKPSSSKSSYKTQINQQLFKKLFFYYYLQLIRQFCSSKNNIQRASTLQYHVKLGRNIIKIVAADYISQQSLFELFYNLIKIQKISKSLDQLQKISSQYQIYCLKHEYNLSIDKTKLQNIKLYARCYLDEMYFLAIKQAQDPQIIQDANSTQSGFVLKSFPINRVKQKNRNM